MGSPQVSTPASLSFVRFLSSGSCINASPLHVCNLKTRSQKPFGVSPSICSLHCAHKKCDKLHSSKQILQRSLKQRVMEDGDDILSYLTVCMTAELGRAANQRPCQWENSVPRQKAEFSKRLGTKFALFERRRACESRVEGLYCDHASPPVDV